MVQQLTIEQSCNFPPRLSTLCFYQSEQGKTSVGYRSLHGNIMIDTFPLRVQQGFVNCTAGTLIWHDVNLPSCTKPGAFHMWGYCRVLQMHWWPVIFSVYSTLQRQLHVTIRLVFIFRWLAVSINREITLCPASYWIMLNKNMTVPGLLVTYYCIYSM